MIPSQKPGIANPTSAKTVLTRSTPELRLTAETMPIGIAIASETESAATRSSSVTGSRRSEEHTSELQSQSNLVCRLLLEKKKRQKAIKFAPSIFTLPFAYIALDIAALYCHVAKTIGWPSAAILCAPNRQRTMNRVTNQLF